MTEINDLSRFILNSTDIVEFKLIRDRKDINDETKAFHPQMAHQIFGETEKIFGYQDLKIRLFYTAGPLHIFFDYKYEQKIDEKLADCVKADNIEEAIHEILPEGGFYSNIDEFVKTLPKNDMFKPCGDKVLEFEVLKDGQKRTFEFYHSSCTTPNFRMHYLRLQSFILWFIDAAQYIDVDDPQWSFFIVYEKYKNSAGNDCYATVGFTTVYEYYAYPEHMRPRISQSLVLPPFQNLGIGTKLIEVIYNYYDKNDKVIDITVEDPSENFTRIKCFIDAKLCRKLKSFAPDKLKEGFSKEMIKEARETYKINKRQCRFIYEILRLLNTNVLNEKEYRNYRLSVKKRLNLSYYKQKMDLKKAEKKGVDVKSTISLLPTVEERIDQLKIEYQCIEDEYNHIIERINESSE